MCYETQGNQKGMNVVYIFVVILFTPCQKPCKYNNFIFKAWLNLILGV